MARARSVPRSRKGVLVEGTPEVPAVRQVLFRGELPFAEPRANSPVEFFPEGRLGIFLCSNPSHPTQFQERPSPLKKENARRELERPDWSGATGAVMTLGSAAGECWEHNASGSAREGAPPPAVPAEQTLQVLSRRNQQRLAVDLLQAAQPEAPQAMPGFGLGKEGFDPNVSFAHRLGIGLRRMVGPYPLPIRLIEMTPHASAAVRGRALAAERAGDTGSCGRDVDAPLRALTLGQKAQRLATWTALAIRGRVVDEGLLPESPGSLADL
jgi:hypothetical protein